MSRNYRCVRFVNLSVSSLGVFSDEYSMFLDMMNDIGIDKKHQLCVIKKMINIAIRATYYIFCCRNRNWDSPDLMQFWFLFFSFFLSFFFFNHPISSSICKLPIHSEIYKICTFRNTNKVSIIIVIVLLSLTSYLQWMNDVGLPDLACFTWCLKKLTLGIEPINFFYIITIIELIQ